jgi:hypothetical protein
MVISSGLYFDLQNILGLFSLGVLDILAGVAHGLGRTLMISQVHLEPD